MRAKLNWQRGVKTMYTQSSKPEYYATKQDTEEVNMCLNCNKTPEECNGECDTIKTHIKASRRDK